MCLSECVEPGPRRGRRREDLYAHTRMLLWTVEIPFGDTLVHTSQLKFKASKTLASLSALPSEIDEAASTIEKKAKDVTKPGPKDNKAKLLRDLLAEM